MHIDVNAQIGADGTSSVVRQLAGFEGVGWSYGQSAVVATLLLDQVSSEKSPWLSCH